MVDDPHPVPQRVRDVHPLLGGEQAAEGLAREQDRRPGRAYGAYDRRNDASRRALFVVDSAGTIAWSAVFPEGADPGGDGLLTALERLAGRGPEARDGRPSTQGVEWPGGRGRAARRW